MAVLIGDARALLWGTEIKNKKAIAYKTLDMSGWSAFVGYLIGGIKVKVLGSVFVALLMIVAVAGCGEKDEEKASQNRPAIPGY
jgi:hypothetical protein